MSNRETNKVQPVDEQKSEESDNEEILQEEEEVNVFKNVDDDRTEYPTLIYILESLPFQILVNSLTLFALFGDDIRIIATDRRADDAFDSITIICLIVFSFEIVLASIAKKDYLNSFFFWLDCISTISQIMDLTMFNIAVGLIGTTTSVKSAKQIAQAGKASRTGSKAARVVRLVRLIRIVKLYKSANEKQSKRLSRQSTARQARHSRASIHPTEDNSNKALEEQQTLRQAPSTVSLTAPESEPERVTESRVSKRLSDATTKKVIILVLLLLLLMPFFSAEYWIEPPSSLDYATRYFKVVSEVEKSMEQDINKTLQFVIDQHRSFDARIGFVTTPFPTITDYQSDDYTYLRESSKDYFFLEFDPVKVGLNFTGDPIMLFITDRSKVDRENSVISIVSTLFVCAVLLFGALTFAYDANVLVLEPIERMILKVNQIAKNPLVAKEMSLLTENLQQETTQIENAIIKIGALLALGFGDAGSAIIGTNMAKSGDVDPMLPGKRKWAIYGFCDIRNFTDATEVLQKDVMLFVNNIAEIVHSMVDRFRGSANKNIGDAFLLVWKINDHEYVEHDGEVQWFNPQYINNLADCSLFAFMKIYAKINREPKILEYRKDARLNTRLPGYKVKMGFGLHIGWGIEGAIGSEFKIDASYLSPNVNMASRLEAATKQYGVALLISSDLQQNFSSDIKKYTRQIDKVTVKGSVRPIGLFTIDQEADDLPPSKEEYLPEEKQAVYSEKRQNFLIIQESTEYNSEQYMKINKDLKLIMRNYSQDFQDKFHQGFQGYLLGNWREAQMWIEKAKLIKPNDGPSSTLITVMQEYGFKAPSDWKGYRELTEK